MTPSQIQCNALFHFCVKIIAHTRVVLETYFFRIKFDVPESFSLAVIIQKRRDT